MGLVADGRHQHAGRDAVVDDAVSNAVAIISMLMVVYTMTAVINAAALVVIPRERSQPARNFKSLRQLGPTPALAATGV